MKRNILSAVIWMLASSALWAADSALNSQVSDAIAKLKSANNYSWTVTTVAPPDAPFTPPPIKGQTDSAGFVRFTVQFGDNTLDVVLKGDKTAFKGEEGWKLAAGGGGFGPDMLALNLARNGPPADEVGMIIKGLTELKALDGGALGGDLSAESATDLLTFGPRHNGAKPNSDFPGPRGAKGSAKVWVKDGALVKFQTHLTGTITFDNNDTLLDFTRTTEIQNVGATKTEIPDEAKKTFESPPAAK